MLLEDGDHGVVRVDALRDGGGAAAAAGLGFVPLPGVATALTRAVPPVRFSPTAPSSPTAATSAATPAIVT